MNKLILIIVSLWLSLMLSIAPLPEGLLQLNPAWCVLTILFWTYRYPNKVNVGIAFCIGIYLDGLTGSMLGTHALAFVIIVYLFDLFYRRFHMYSILQQSIVIGILVASNFLITSCVTHLLTDTLIVWPALLCAVTSAIAWPFYRLLEQPLGLMRS